MRLVALLFATATAAAALVAAREQYSPVQMLCLVNRERARKGLRPLGLDAKLARAAQGHSDYQARTRKMSHTGSGGSTPSKRISQAGYNWKSSGENVAYGYKSMAEVMKTWMNSPGHRANILGKQFTHFGSAVAYSGSTPYYTQNFGSNGQPATNIPKCDGSDAAYGGGNDYDDDYSSGGDDYSSGGDDYGSDYGSGGRGGRGGNDYSSGGRGGNHGGRGGNDYGSGGRGGRGGNDYPSSGGRGGNHGGRGGRGGNHGGNDYPSGGRGGRGGNHGGRGGNDYPMEGGNDYPSGGRGGNRGGNDYGSGGRGGRGGRGGNDKDCDKNGGGRGGRRGGSSPY